MTSDNLKHFKHLFAILQFRKPKGAMEIPIDLVPGTWVFRSGVDEPWFSKYPPKEDWGLVKEWTKMLKTPEAHWGSYKAKILGHADDWEKAEERLKRAYTRKNIMNSDIEYQKNPVKPTVLSTSETNKLLQNRSFMKNNVSRKTLQTQNYIHGNASQLENVRKSKESASDSSSDSSFAPQARSKSKNKATNRAIVSDDSQSDDETRSDTSKHESPALSGNTVIVSDDGEKNPTEQLDRQADKNKKNDILQPETFNQLRTYFDKKFEDLQIIMDKRIYSAKKSILYDVKARCEEIKMVIGNIKIDEKPQGTRAELKEKLEINLPIETLPDFLKFEEELRTNEDKKKVLMDLLLLMCFDFSNVKDCIHKILPQIIKKEIQGQYSGQGRKKKGVGKLDFSATVLFECFEAAIIKHCPADVKSLKSKIGDWLAHWDDRDGGRKER